MIAIEKFELDNGLKVVVHRDDTTPMVAFNLLYDVGARDEDPERTGFAHLFEHLMFEGSVNIPNYDTPLQKAGGENNAFTNNNITNYYINVPKENLETAFWLESDRMLELALTQEKLDIQKNVVIEEFKQRYLNQPYGDWHLLIRPLAYKKHPYQWATIGKEIRHIEEATLDDVKAFFFKHYAPNNAILTVVGDVELAEIKALAEKWFGPIPRRDVPVRDLVQEPRQEEARTQSTEGDVPLDAFFQVYHMVDRLHPDYYAMDLLSDLLSNGQSSRLIQRLVKEQALFSNLNAYITGDIDAGLFMISGHLNEGVRFEEAEAAIRKELNDLMENPVEPRELEKVVNKVESSLVFSEINALNKAMNLAYFELLGDAHKCNDEAAHYRAVKPEDIQRVARELFRKENSSTLYYNAKKQTHAE